METEEIEIKSIKLYSLFNDFISRQERKHFRLQNDDIYSIEFIFKIVNF